MCIYIYTKRWDFGVFLFGLYLRFLTDVFTVTFLHMHRKQHYIDLPLIKENFCEVSSVAFILFAST